nr:ribonuclease HI [Sphingomonas jinjuensis]
MKIFFDGGSRGNPGSIEVAVVAGGRAIVRTDLGEGSSADAEWLALIYAAETAREIGGEVVLLGDSADVIAKANGRVACRGEAAAYRERFLSVAGALPVRHIGRTQNLAGIALARRHPR